MSYGINAPQGFVPYQIKDSQGIPNTPYNEDFFLASGYAQNIGVGDLIWLNPATGFVENFSNSGGAYASTYRVGPVLGVYQGVQYVSTTDTTNPNLPWRDNWVANTVTDGAVPARVRFLPLSYGYWFTIQVGATGAPQTAIGQFGTVTYSATGGLVNVQTSGQSTIYLDVSTTYPYRPQTAAGGTQATLCQIMAFDNRNGASQVGIPYGNVLVRLADSQLPTFSSYVP